MNPIKYWQIQSKAIISLALCLCISYPNLIITQKYDYEWALGYQRPIEKGYGISSINFDNKQVKLSTLFERQDANIGYNGSFICNKDGSLVLITSGCNILDRNGNEIINGDSLSPGNLYNQYCLPNRKDYPVINGNFFISCTSWGDIYYLIHQSGKNDNVKQDVICERLYRTKIEVDSTGTLIVIEKNRPIYNDETNEILISALMHVNADKWWIHFMDYNTNRHQFLLLGKDSIISQHSQEIGPVTRTKDIHSFQNIFSPNGKYYVYGFEKMGLIWFDFDSESGLLSNPRIISTADNSIFIRGICFSPDSRLLYFTQDTNLYQVDLSSTSPDYDLQLIASVFDRTETGWTYSIGTMHQGPDCRIYVSPASTVNRMHVIHHPNLKGKDCAFEKDAIHLKTRLDISTPNFMHFRTGPGQMQCDSSIKWLITNTETANARDFHFYPNPVIDELNLKFNTETPDHLRIEIISVDGKYVKSVIQSKNEILKPVDFSGIPPGMYFLRFYSEDLLITNSKIIKL